MTHFFRAFVYVVIIGFVVYLYFGEIEKMSPFDKRDRIDATYYGIIGECGGFDIPDDINKYDRLKKTISQLASDSFLSDDARISLWRKIERERYSLFPPVEAGEMFSSSTLITKCVARTAKRYGELGNFDFELIGKATRKKAMRNINTGLTAIESFLFLLDNRAKHPEKYQYE